MLPFCLWRNRIVVNAVLTEAGIDSPIAEPVAIFSILSSVQPGFVTPWVLKNELHLETQVHMLCNSGPVPTGDLVVTIPKSLTKPVTPRQTDTVGRSSTKRERKYLAAKRKSQRKQGTTLLCFYASWQFWPAKVHVLWKNDRVFFVLFRDRGCSTMVEHGPGLNIAPQHANQQNKGSVVKCWAHQCQDWSLDPQHPCKILAGKVTCL